MTFGPYSNKSTRVSLGWMVTLLLISFRLSAGLAQDTEPSLVAKAAELGDWTEIARLVQSQADVTIAQPDGMTPLHWAAFHGKEEWVKQWVAKYDTPDVKTFYNVTPLEIACVAGHATIAKVLIEAGARADGQGSSRASMLHLAARTGTEDIIKELIKSGAEVDATDPQGQTPLMWAAAAGNTGAVKCLLQLEADPNLKSKGGFTALAFAARQGKIAAATTLLDAGVDVNDVIDNKSKGERNPRDGMSPLMLAVESGHFELAIELVRRGADPNDERSEFTPLHAVVWTRKANVGDDPSGDPIPQGSGSLSSLDFVREIVALGADVNRQLRRGAGGRAKLNLRDATPFLMAAKTADLPLLKLLLESGANPTLTNADGTTPILATAGIGVTAVGEEPGTETEVIETIDWLVRLGADVNAIDENGETAMHGAAYRNYPIEVEHLAKLGADPAAWNRKNEYGWTPIMIAQGQRPGSFKPSPETIAALERAMTKTTDNDRVDK